MVVVANGLFGCQVWNVTQAHVGELEATHSKLLRKMFNMPKLAWSRGDIMKYIEAKNLNILPIEWKMMKLQLRYVGHEVRVSPERVVTLPHNVLFRGYSSCGPRLPGGVEQSYNSTIRRALEMCGLSGTRWVALAKIKKAWNKYLEVEAPVIFLKAWYGREEFRKEQRSMSAERQYEKELARLEPLVNGLEDGREDDERMVGSGDIDMGVESDDNSEIASEGEMMEMEFEDYEMGGRIVEIYQCAVSSVSIEQGDQLEVINLNNRASMLFMETLQENGVEIASEEITEEGLEMRSTSMCNR